MISGSELLDLSAASEQFFLAPRGLCTGVDQLAGGVEEVHGVSEGSQGLLFP